MADEMRLVGRDVLDADAALIALHVDDAVDHQKRISMRKRGENFSNSDGLNRFAGH